MLKSKKMKTLMTAAVASLCFTAANAQETTLTISSWAPPTHGVNAKIWPDLISRIEAATDGRCNIEVFQASQIGQEVALSKGLALGTRYCLHRYLRVFANGSATFN